MFSQDEENSDTNEENEEDEEEEEWDEEDDVPLSQLRSEWRKEEIGKVPNLQPQSSRSQEPTGPITRKRARELNGNGDVQPLKRTRDDPDSRLGSGEVPMEVDEPITMEIDDAEVKMTCMHYIREFFKNLFS